MIHEGRFTYGARGLVCLADLGVLWESDTGMPLPAYPQKVLERIATTPDEAYWHSVEHEPPVKVTT